MTTVVAFRPTDVAAFVDVVAALHDGVRRAAFAARGPRRLRSAGRNADVRSDVVRDALGRLDPHDRAVLADALPALGRLAAELERGAPPTDAA